MDTINFVAPAEVSVTGQASSTSRPDLTPFPPRPPPVWGWMK